jgi:hypothetical protein
MSYDSSREESQEAWRTSNPNPRPVWRRPIPLALLTIVVLVVVLGLAYVMEMSAITREGTRRETQLRAEYLICQARLSQYYTNGENSLQIASQNAQQIKSIMTDVASGKYGDAQKLADPHNQVYLAIVQSYPNVGSVSDAYKAAQSVLVGSYNDYTEENQKLWTMLSDYDNWRTGGWIQSPLIARAGFPSNRLVAVDGGQVFYGAQAEAQMWKIVANPSVAQSYRSGNLQPIAFPTP